MHHQANLFKVSARTGETVGPLGRAFKSDVRLPEGSGTKSEEYTYTEEFIEAHDRAVGMIFPGGSFMPRRNG